MKIIREKSTKRVFYFFNDNDEVILSEKHLSGFQTDASINSINFELVENTAPLMFDAQFGAVSYDGSFHIIDQAAYDLNKSKFETQQVKNNIKSQIYVLEEKVTPRRTREAILGVDNGWLTNVELQIEELRGQL